MNWIEYLARVGWLSKGFVFVVIGIIGTQIATSTWQTEENATQVGALRALAGRPVSAVLIIAVSVGLVVFMIWNLAQAVVPGSTDLDPLGIAKRIGWAGLGLFYGSIALAGFRMVTSSDPSTSSTSAGSDSTDATALTARLLGATGGRVVAVAIAIGIIIVAGYHLHKGATYGFVDDLDTDDLDPAKERWLGRLGVGGFVARGLVLIAVAVFLMEAAIEFDADEANGLDGALREVASVTTGRVIVFATGVGLVIAGLYDMATFRRQQLR